MATNDNESGIHPVVMQHIVDLHRKHAELQMQMHDKTSEDQDGMQAVHATLTELNGLLRELITVMKEDVKADTAVAHGGTGRRKQYGAKPGPGTTEGEA